MEPVLRALLAHQALTVLRLDASVAFGSAGWKQKLKLFELTSVGVGGLALTPVAAEVVQELVVPHLGEAKLRGGPDTRDALFGLLEDLAVTLKLRKPTVALVEERDDDSGVAEYDDLAGHFRDGG